jgi:translocator protein
MKYWKLLVSIVLVQLVGIAGGVFTYPAIEGWYSGLEKSALTPPGWVFGPAWTILYLLMAIAVYLVWQKGWKKALVRSAVWIFIGQLGLNLLWSMLFFGLHNPAVALVDIGLLWLMIVWTIWAFAKISKPAAWLLVPYILWVSFAAYLNYVVVALN